MGEGLGKLHQFGNLSSQPTNRACVNPKRLLSAQNFLGRVSLSALVWIWTRVLKLITGAPCARCNPNFRSETS